jgi:hypothetical protein
MLWFLHGDGSGAGEIPGEIWDQADARAFPGIAEMQSPEEFARDVFEVTGWR